MHLVRTDGRLWADHQSSPVREVDGGVFPGRRPADRPARAERDVGQQPPGRLDHHQGGYWVSLPLCLAQRGQLFPVYVDRIHSQAAPYHYKDRGLIIGDAAHSQVPFYGQGLNCGLEDVRVLDYFLQESNVGPTVELNGSEKRPEDERLCAALAKYTETRHEDLVAICDMAMRQ